MPRTNGSYIGIDADPTSSQASGIWSVRDAERLLRSGKWPSPVPPPTPTTLYFNAAVDSDWQTLGNWWTDGTFTTQATSLPTSIDNVIVYIPPEFGWFPLTNSGGQPTVANITFPDYNYLFQTSALDITVIGLATFNNFAANSGTINGNAIFNNWASNEGIVTGTATFNDEACNRGGTAGTFVPDPPPTC